MTRHLLIAAIFTTLLLTGAGASADSSLPPPNNIRLTYVDYWLNNEQQVWICPTDSNVIIANWRDFRLSYRQMGIGRSDDGGLTWTDSLVNHNMQMFGYDSKQSDPTMNVDRQGNFYMTALDWDAFGFTGLNTIVFYKSTDKGISWTGPVPCVWSGNSVTFEDKQFVAIDRTGGIYDGNIYCIWARFYDGPNRLQFVRSIDGAQTFEDTIIVGPQQHPIGCSVRGAGQFAFPLVNSNGDVHCFWVGTAYDSSGNCTGVQTIKHAISADGGQSFTYPDTVLTVSGYQYAAGGINTYSAPAADADITDGPFDGNIYMSFTNVGPEDAYRSDVDFIRSLDNGVTWSQRIQINDAVASDLIDSFHPWLIVNQEGVIMVIFYDQRFDSPNYYLFDLVAAYSFDGGLTFTGNHRITTASSSPGDLKSDESKGPIIDSETGLLRPLADSRGGLIGEYIGVTAFHDKINAVWTDSRDGNSETYTANWYLPLLEPRLAGPESGSYQSSAPSFVWATSWKHDQDRYRLEISTDENFGENVVSRTVDTNLYTLDISLDDGNYFWRVKSLKTTNADSSEYSAVRSFTIDATPPGPPQLSEPADETVTLNAQPFFDWSDETKAGAPVTYSLFVSTDPAFTPGPSTHVYSSLTVSELNLPDPLQPDMLTYWKVEAIDGASNSSTSVAFTVTYSSLACGDVDGDGGPGVTIADLVYMVDYMFNGGLPPPVMAAADVDGSGGDLDISDLVYMVDYMFNGGPVPVCR
jgi:hypothetical protein